MLLLLLLLVVVVVEIELSFNLLKVVLALLLRAETFVCQKKKTQNIWQKLSQFLEQISRKNFFFQNKVRIRVKNFREWAKSKKKNYSLIKDLLKDYLWDCFMIFIIEKLRILKNIYDFT